MITYKLAGELESYPDVQSAAEAARRLKKFSVIMRVEDDSPDEAAKNFKTWAYVLEDGTLELDEDKK